MRLYCRADPVRAHALDSSHIAARYELEQLSDRRSIATTTSVPSPIYSYVKRLADIVGSGLLLIVLSPLFLTIGVGITLETGFPIVYRGQRLGRNGRAFWALKFRTMRDGSHHDLRELLRNDEDYRLEYERTLKLRDDPRRTRVGVALRRTSLDELPQLWNVLRGQMSLIGPRPYSLRDLEAIPEKDEILSIRPGMTGLWQVSGRSDLSLEQRVELDTRYVRERGYRLDAWIAMRTLGAVISGRGAY